MYIMIIYRCKEKLDMQRYRIMEKYTFNAERSKEIYKKYRSLLEVKQCYANVFRVYTRHNPSANSGRWRVAYGYMTSGIPGLLLRHCFLIDECGRVVDPTILVARDKIRQNCGVEDRGDGNKWPTYYAMYIFSDVSEYAGALVHEGKYALEKTLRKYEDEARNWAFENGLVLAG